jgi:WhiB family transcriptional regulator, redox-sensing transcriptional regulator
MRPTTQTHETREETEFMTDTLIGPELREQATGCGGDLPCREYDADLWFSETPTELEFAKSLCADCPVRIECLAGALERREPWGVWGGEIFEKGAIVARKRPRGRPRKDAVAAEQAAQAELAARTAELVMAGVKVS